MITATTWGTNLSPPGDRCVPAGRTAVGRAASAAAVLLTVFAGGVAVERRADAAALTAPRLGAFLDRDGGDHQPNDGSSHQVLAIALQRRRLLGAMGSYSQLTIGEIVFAWKYHVPTFLTLVFSPDDLFIEREEPVVDPDDDDPVEVDPDELYIEKGGYRTTVARAKAVLDEYGYTVPFFAEIYQSFRDDLNEQARDLLDDEIGGREGPDPDEVKLKAQVNAHLSAGSNTAIGDLEAFTAFLREAIETDLKMEPFLEDLVYDRGPGTPPRRIPVSRHLRYRSSDLADFDTLHMLILDTRASRRACCGR
jgi:hypothetical protein